MKLYQHSVRCPKAMQIFLDANPQYWRFIPMTVAEAQRSDEHHVAPLVFPQPLGVNQRSQEQCQHCLDALPSPPTGFEFSKQQIFQQTQYFHLKQDRTSPSEDLDLYQTSVVAVCKYC